VIDSISAVSPSLPAVRELSPDGIRADSLTVANLYGGVPATVATFPVIYQAVNPQPGAVSAVSPVVRIAPSGEQRSQFIDQYV
jgi:hypothetical protein